MAMLDCAANLVVSCSRAAGDGMGTDSNSSVQRYRHKIFIGDRLADDSNSQFQKTCRHVNYTHDYACIYIAIMGTAPGSSVDGLAGSLNPQCKRGVRRNHWDIFVHLNLLQLLNYSCGLSRIFQSWFAEFIRACLQVFELNLRIFLMFFVHVGTSLFCNPRLVADLSGGYSKQHPLQAWFVATRQRPGLHPSVPWAGLTNLNTNMLLFSSNLYSLRSTLACDGNATVRLYCLIC